MSGFKYSDFKKMDSIMEKANLVETQARFHRLETKNLLATIKKGSVMLLASEKTEAKYRKESGTSKRLCELAVDVFAEYTRQRKRFNVADSLEEINCSPAYARYCELEELEMGL